MRKLKLFFACLLMAVLSIGQMWGAEGDTHDISASNNSTFPQTKNLNSGAEIPNATITGLSYPVKKVELVVRTNKAVSNVDIEVLVGSTSLGTQNKSGNSTSTLTYQTNPVSSLSGDITIIFTNNCTGTSQQGSIWLNTVTLTEGASSGSSKCSTPSISPAACSFYGSQQVTITTSTTDAAIYYTTDGSAPSKTNGTLYPGSAITVSDANTTVKAIAVKDGMTDSDVASVEYTYAGPAVTSYDIDFESVAAAYVNWDFNNIGIRSTITPHGGSHYGANVNSGGNGVQTASITTKAKYAAPGILTFYISKESNNTTASYWKAQVSSNGTDWTDVQQFDAHSSAMNSGAKWNECTADLSAYTNVYVRISYGSSGAIRAIDDISLEAASNVAKPSITGEDNFLTSTEVTMECTTDGAAIYYTTTESAKATPATSGAWMAYNGASKPSFSATTTVWAAAKKGSDWSDVATKTFNKATILTPSEALAIINGWSSNKTSTEDYYVAGTVSTITTINVGGTGEYFISDDGTTTDQLQVYKGKWVNGANFTSANQLIEGDDVTIKGKLKKYNSYKELDQNNEVVLYKLKARLAWSEASYEADMSGSNTFPTLSKPDGVTVTYSSTNTDAATINPSTGAISLVEVGSTTIKATFTGNETYKANEVSYTLTVSNSVLRADISFEENGGSAVADMPQQSNLPNSLPTITKAGYNFDGWWTTSDFQDGTEAVAGAAVTSTDPITLYAKWDDPYTVTKALEIIDGLADNGETGNVYVSGIVCTAPSSLLSGGYLTYYISVDGTETNRLQVYKGKDENNVAFTNKDDVQKDDQVVVYGPLKKFKQGENIIPEFNTGNYLYSLSRKADAELSWGTTEFTAYIGESNDYPTLTNDHGVTVTYSSSETDYATINPSTGAISLVAAGNTTITATFAGNDGYKADAVSYTLKVRTPLVHGSITYEENGGSEVADVADATELPDPLPSTTRAHYSFAGWWTTSTFEDGTEAVAGASLTGNTILYAKWTALPVWSYTYTSNVTTSAPDSKVIPEDTEEYDAWKIAKAGSITLTVPAGTTVLHFHLVAWKGEGGAVTISGDCFTSDKVITAVTNDGISNSSPFTLSGEGVRGSDFYYSLTPDNAITENTVITFTTASGKRAVVFGVNAIYPEITLDPASVAFGNVRANQTKSQEFTITTNENVSGTLNASIINENVSGKFSVGSISAGKVTVTFDPDGATSGDFTAKLKVWANNAEVTADLSGTAIAAETPEIVVDKNAIAFGRVDPNAEVSETIAVELLHIDGAVSAALSGTNADKFSLSTTSLSTNGNIVVTPVTTANGVFSATLKLTATDADDVEIPLSITVANKWAVTYTSNVDIASNESKQVTIAGTDYDAAKSNKGTTATITLPQGVTTIHLHLVAWKDEAQTVSVTGACFNEAKELAIAANDAVSGSAAKYDLGASGIDYYFSLTPDNAVAANEVITITAASGKRFVLFGVNQEGGIYGTYTRTVSGNYGTICLPKAGVLTNGTLFEIAYYGQTSKKIFFDEILNNEMVAGRPYLFKPNDGVTELRVNYTDNEDPVAAGNYKGLHGFYDLTNENATFNIQQDAGNYIMYSNQYWEVSGRAAYIENYRAYIVLSDITTIEPAKAPGTRRVSLNVNGEQTATGIDALNAEEAPVKMMIDGQLFILRGEKLYDATGRLVK